MKDPHDILFPLCLFSLILNFVLAIAYANLSRRLREARYAVEELKSTIRLQRRVLAGELTYDNAPVPTDEEMTA